MFPGKAKAIGIGIGGLLRRFKLPPPPRTTTTTRIISSSSSSSCQYGSRPKYERGPAFWTILYGQAAIFLGINGNLAFAEDGPAELGTGNEIGEAGLRRIEDGSVVSNKHTSKWWIFTKMARDLHREGKLEEAERYLLLALEEAKEGFGERDPHVASACNNLAELYRVNKAFDKADPLYMKALNILEESYGPDDIRVAVAFDNLGQFYLVQQKLEEARVSYERALKIKRPILGLGHTDYADTMYHLGRVLYLQGKEKDSEALIQDSIRILEEAGEKESVKCLRRLRYLSQMHRKSNRLTEAEIIQRKILHIIELSQGWNSLETANAAEDLALTLQSMGSLKEAQELLERCLDVRKSVLHEDHLQIGASMLRLAQVTMLNSIKLMKVDSSVVSTEFDKAKTHLHNSIRIAHNILDTVKAKRSKMWNKSASKRVGKDEHAALFIMLQSYVALGLLEKSKQELQEPTETYPLVDEAVHAFRRCRIAFKEAVESGIPTFVVDSPDIKGEYMLCLKHLLGVLRKSKGYSTQQSLQELEDEIQGIETQLKTPQI